MFPKVNTQANIVQDKLARCTLVSDSGKLGGSCPPMPALLYTVWCTGGHMPGPGLKAPHPALHCQLLPTHVLLHSQPVLKEQYNTKPFIVTGVETCTKGLRSQEYC